MQDSQLGEDIFRYAADTVRKNGTITMCIGALTAFVGVNATLVITHSSVFSAGLMAAAVALLPHAYRYWFDNYFRLAHFSVSVTKGYRVVEIGVAPLSDVHKFRPIPHQFVRDADSAAPTELMGQIREMTSVFSELREKLSVCEEAHATVTNYDAANLLLMQEGLCAAKMPGYQLRIGLPEAAHTAREQNSQS